MIKFEKSEIKEAKYIAVEMAPRKEEDKSNKIKGLFLGCQPMVKDNTQLVAKDEEFIWLHRGDNVYMLNTLHYKIVDIEIERQGKLTTFIAGTNQEEYTKRLKMIQEIYAEKDQVLKSGLIDMDNYVVSDKLKKELESNVEKKSESATPKGTVWNQNSAYNNRSGACNYGTGSVYGSHSSVYTAKKPSTTMFKRTTKYPISPAIDRMKAKVEEIKNGTYLPPKLPAIPADKNESEKPKKNETVTKSAAEQYEDEDYYGCFH